jgi:hypothetical protein
MKYLIPLLLFIGCTPNPVPPSLPIKNYECTLLTNHGSYAHMQVGATSEEEAVKIAETVRDRLVKAQRIPECGVLCELKEIK